MQNAECKMRNERRLDLIDREKVYQLACVGCTRHGEAPGECYHDEPCERLIFAFTVAEPVDAVEVVRCKDCKHKGWIQEPCHGKSVDYCRALDFCINNAEKCFCSYGERREGE